MNRRFWNIAERSRPFPTGANHVVGHTNHGTHRRMHTPTFPNRCDCAARPEAGNAHGNQQGQRGLLVSEDGNPKERAALCKALPVGVPFFRLFPHERKESAPGGMDKITNTTGHPGRPAAPVQENDNRQKAAERSRPFPTMRRIGACGNAERSRPFPTMRRIGACGNAERSRPFPTE
jgi:hypothetical protein